MSFYSLLRLGAYQHCTGAVGIVVGVGRLGGIAAIVPFWQCCTIVPLSNAIFRWCYSSAPQDADYFRQQGKAYSQQLQALDDYAKKTFATIAPEKRKVLTSHDAFGYFSQAYGVTFLAPLGYSTEAEASSKQVAALIRQIKQEKIASYFIENQTNPRLVKQIANASDAQPGGERYPEALTDNTGPAANYTAAFKHNVHTLAASMK